MIKTVYFGDAVGKAAMIVAGTAPASAKPLIIRDLLGRIAVAIDCEREECGEMVSRLEGRISELGAHAASPGVLCADDFFQPELVFQDPTILDFRLPGSDLSVRLLERQVTGQDWLIRAKAGNLQENSTVPHVVFFGLKGGVGRSTALAMLAYELAKKSRQVLLVDLDLESPGLSTLVLPPERVPEFGVVDWLLEDAVGQGAEVYEQLVTVSPLSDNVAGDIKVVSAAGREDLFYVDKLSRAYADVSEGDQAVAFSTRIRRLITTLVAREAAEIVLIDSRAGLHDLAALSIVGLASTALLFATGSAQSWQGYQSLFGHWQARPQVAREIRDRLKMVNALFPESDQAARAKLFLERSYSLFEMLYDEVPPGETGLAEGNLFNFDRDDDTAPHYPLRIRWSSRFQEFDPLQMSRGLFTEDEVRASYGDFIDGVLQLTGDSEHQ